MLPRFILFFLIAFANFAHAGLFDSKPAFLPPEQAFTFSYKQQNDQLALNWQIADGYYLYKKEIRIQGNHAEFREPIFPQSERYHDEFFGEVEIFRHELRVNVPLVNVRDNAQVEVSYQGCTKGFCYPPETKIITLNTANTPAQAGQNPQNIAISALTEQPQAEQNQLAEQLSSSRFSIFWFFVLGIGLAFTPCVLPMLPLLSAVVIGSQNRPSTARAFLLSLSYVQGMALTYTALGLIVAAIGLPFQIALQSPTVLIGLAVLFSLLALSMFGLFEIKLPNSWQQKLNNFSQKQQGGAFGGVFFMGMIAGLVASPCTSAPLSGALLYVAQSGDLLTGGLALYLLALGMGIPLILITLFGNRILPKSGAWMLNVKTAFGFVMLALPVFLLSRVFVEAEPYLWSALAFAFLFWLSEQIHTTSIIKKALKVLVLMSLALSAKPWVSFVWQEPQRAQTVVTNHFERITTLAELEQKLSDNRDKKVMLDLYADWCAACKEFEKYTFINAQVKAKLDKMLVLQVDMTKNSTANDELMKKFNVLGLPTILFFDEQGNEIPQMRVTGFLNEEAFLEWLFPFVSPTNP